VSTVERRNPLHKQAANNSKNNAGLAPARKRRWWANSITGEAMPIAMSLALVGLATATLALVSRFGPLHHLILLVYMLPVVLAATRWGVVAGLVAAIAGAAAADFFFYPPLYSFWLENRKDVIDLLLYFLVAVVTSNLAARLKSEADTSRRRAREIGELHAFSQRLATCLTSRELIFAVQDYLSNTLGYRVVLLAGPAAPESASLAVPEAIRREASELAAANKTHTLTKVDPRTRSTWLITTIVPEILGYGAIAIELGAGSAEGAGHIATHVAAVIEEVTASLKNLKVKEAIEQATLNYQTEILRDALVGGVSHELRTPLASILGTCSVLDQMPAILNDEPSHTLIDAIHGQAIALDKQIRDILDAVRISAKGVHPQLIWTDPTDIVDAAVKQKTARLAGHQIVFDVRQDVPLVYVDSVLVEQAFGQLLENAAKYSPAGTAIKISSRCDRGFVELSVTDQGSGLTAEEKEQLGRRSYRSERNAAVSGSGLGLWIASTFIAANGGTLCAESDGPNLGTTISLRLPTVSDDTPELLDALND
jgi:K+-sensing histidine kinase KdpD